MECSFLNKKMIIRNLPNSGGKQANGSSLFCDLDVENCM